MPSHNLQKLVVCCALRHDTYRKAVIRELKIQVDTNRSLSTNSKLTA